MNLDQLIKGCIKQNRKAQEELYQMYKKTLFALSLKYCTNEAEAEDNLHDSFIEIFSSIKNYKGKGSFEGWIKKITINKAITRYKQSYILTAIKDEYQQDDFVTENEIDLPLDTLLNFIQELPHQYRLVFNLYELDDFSHQEIANMLSISENTSKSNLHRAKQILKEKIKPKSTFYYSKQKNGK
ncbi:RNA polymerase sigma factor [Flavobacterium zhairuonense]|uniref:RNA polymerase sigma factor n=1 Tax=Flavobacterium zhairuonense TaxID=2493631 RepID=UPI0010471B01|nr:RNA polymerase sigma factor [Flavobacterium zhairuonense]KAF2507849.1 RNA polymerase sigma factor [Flavobacterium zhairuonense]